MTEARKVYPNALATTLWISLMGGVVSSTINRRQKAQ